jgi:Tol biopolymer transport system component
MCMQIAATLFALFIQASPGVMYHFPQWSHDGRFILVSSTLDGDAEIYLLPIDGGTPIKLTHNSASDDLARWRPDANRIVFVTDRRGRSETFSMRPDGSDQRPDEGVHLAATSRHGRRTLVEDAGMIFSVDSVTKVRQAVTSGAWAEQAAFSPDGKSIVYEQRLSSDPHDVTRSNVVVANADGSRRSVVAQGTDPSWSPDGTVLLFKVLGQSADELWIATAFPDGTGLRRLSRGAHPQWSPDGQRIVFMLDRGMDADIWVMGRDGTNRRCLTCS